MNITDLLGIRGNELVDDIFMMASLSRMIEMNSRKDVILIDSLLSEKKKLDIRTFSRLIVHPRCIVIFPFFIRSPGHWLLIVIDQRIVDDIKMFICDSYDMFFQNENICFFINYIGRALKKEEMIVECVMMTNQRTGWECGYRVMKMVDLLLQNDFNIDCFSLFNYQDFLMNFITEIRKNKNPN